MFGLIIYGKECTCLYFTQFNFMVERQESKCPNAEFSFVSSHRGGMSCQPFVVSGGLFVCLFVSPQ